MTHTSPHRAAAALFAAAEGILAGLLDAPTSIDLWFHHQTPEHLVNVADEYDVKIRIGPFHAVACARPFPIDFDIYYISTNVTDDALSLYQAHNERFDDKHAPDHPCAGGNCSDPAAHAEGAHDL